jgi:hypothetical protein
LSSYVAPFIGLVVLLTCDYAFIVLNYYKEYGQCFSTFLIVLY